VSAFHLPGQNFGPAPEKNEILYVKEQTFTFPQLPAWNKRELFTEKKENVIFLF